MQEFEELAPPQGRIALQEGEGVALRTVPPTRRPPALLPRGASERLLATCGGGPRGHRDRITVLLLWRGLLRAGEACSVGVEDLEALAGGGMTLRVQAPKGVARGAPRRLVGLDPRTAAFCQAWLEVRPGATGLPGASGPLLASSQGVALRTSHLRRLLRRLGQAAGLGRVHPHALRGLGASELVREGYSMRHVQLALGHTQLSSTVLYLRSIGADETAEKMTQRRW